MRGNGFLRTPLRGDQQNRLRNLAVSEAPLAGDPAPDAVFPQTLVLGFDLAPTDAEIEVAPLWEGWLTFVPASTAGNPTVAGDVVEDRYDRWSVTGDLLLRTPYVPGPALDAAFRTHLPGFDPVPDLVRYSTVRLTEEFLFGTLLQMPRRRFDLGGTPVAVDDPEYHRKLVIGILSGRGSLWCAVDSADPRRDIALLPMPVVAGAPGAGAARVLAVSLASTAVEVLSPSWFDQRPAYDDLSGEQLVPPALRTFAHQRSDPAHPAHSVIPARALFQAAPAAVFAPDQPVTAPLRAALAAPLPGGRRYRRVAVRRPVIPGPSPGAAQQRPFPAHRLCWRPSGGGDAESLRMPMSGVAYLPLADDSYRFWVVPRSADPAAVVAGEQVRLSLPPVLPRLAGGPPQTALDVPIGAGAGAAVDAHLREYDAAMIWEGYRAVRPRQVLLQNRASARWNVNAHFDWTVAPHAVRPPQSALYSLFRESAGRHGLAPEFVQVVFFGEGGNLALASSGAFDTDAVLDAYGFVGLDLILYRAGRLPAGRPAVPPEVPAAEVLERAEYTFDLVAAGYLDPSVAAAVTWKETLVRKESGYPRTLDVGSVHGWSAAIELVAAELHARLDEMTAYLAAKVPAVVIDDETSRRFLAYLRFNTKPANARQRADALAANLRPWTGPTPSGIEDARYNSLQRVAITAWHEEGGAYRDAQVAP